ncbi:hypothetical protein MOQ_000738 [Trypanosoma cruzi marinkellei]|uniref:Ubiquitin-like domain-containing protein n=1 Tax=Trypanosoma cruzi marinkellei TaxID=85056 RepID=K2PDN5_TRYCR|nr:hypothetical protein MOQ_000738 [Trypanosoma cruzi marinkellei]
MEADSVNFDDVTPSFVRRRRLSERVANVLQFGRPPSRGASSINRLAPNASTAPPRTPPPALRKNPQGSITTTTTTTRRSASTAAVLLAPPIDKLLLRTHDVATQHGEAQPSPHQQLALPRNDTYAHLVHVPKGLKDVMAVSASLPVTSDQVTHNHCFPSPSSSFVSPSLTAEVSCRRASEYSCGTQMSQPHPPQQERSSGISSSQMTALSLRKLSCEDSSRTGELTVLERTSRGGERGESNLAQYTTTYVVPYVMEEKQEGEEEEEEEEKELPGLPFQQEEYNEKRHVSHQQIMETKCGDDSRICLKSSTSFWDGTTPPADVEIDTLQTRRSIFPPTSFLSTSYEGSDVTTLLVVAKGGLSVYKGENNDHNMSHTSEMEMKLASGPLVVRVFVPKALLEEVTVRDLKMEVERQVDIAATQQTLRADGVVLLDELPLSFLDPSTILFMDVELPLGDRAEEHARWRNRHVVSQTEPLPTLQHREASSLSSSSECITLLEHMEKFMRAPVKQPHIATETSTVSSTTSPAGVLRPTILTVTASPTRHLTTMKAPLMTPVIVSANSNHRAASQENPQAANCMKTANDTDNTDDNDNNDGMMHERRKQYTVDATAIFPPQDMAGPSSSVLFDVDSAMHRDTTAVDAVLSNRPSVNPRGLLEDAMTRAQQQVDLLTWLCCKSGYSSQRSGGNSLSGNIRD